jgi:tRNA(Ile)-lysidine synthase
MIRKVKEAIEMNHLLRQGDKVVVAVSGGCDSIALLTVLEMLSDEYRLSLIVAHINHGLRENAAYEEEFVRGIAEEMGVLFECKSLDVRSLRKGTGKSIEEIGREVRYDFLKDVANRHGAQRIALGHNSDDQTETVLMNFLRGSGPPGLRGMLPERDSFYIRPLLGVTRDEIISFLESRELPFVTDSSNTDPAYLRNRIRHSLIPELKARYNPALEESIKNMAEIMRLEDDYMNGVTSKILSEWGLMDAAGEIRISIHALAEYHEAIQKRIMKRLLERLTTNSQGIGQTHIKAALNLVYSDHPAAYIDLPCNIGVRREYDALVIFKRKRSEKDVLKKRYHDLCYEVTLPGSVRMEELGKKMIFEFVEGAIDIKSNARNTAFMDYERISLPLVIRTVRPGDRIQPLGMKGMKKIKAVFIDEKIALQERRRIPLLIDQEAVLWIAGLRLSERVKITKKTRYILRVELV